MWSSKCTDSIYNREAHAVQCEVLNALTAQYRGTCSTMWMLLQYNVKHWMHWQYIQYGDTWSTMWMYMQHNVKHWMHWKYIQYGCTCSTMWSSEYTNKTVWRSMQYNCKVSVVQCERTLVRDFLQHVEEHFLSTSWEHCQLLCDKEIKQLADVVKSTHIMHSASEVKALKCIA